jgi:hypothetical protein
MHGIYATDANELDIGIHKGIDGKHDKKRAQ